jgi:hypothetical protein
MADGTAALLGVAMLAAGVVYGTDAFFALVGRAALARSGDAALVEVVGSLHAVADRRMPVVGATALGSTLAYALSAGSGSASGRLALVALVALAAHLALYLAVAKPINARLTAAAAALAAHGGEVPAEARAWQRRWDRVIVPRAALLAVAVGALTGAALAR